MCMNVIDLSKSVSFVLEDIDIGGQIQYLTCTGPFYFNGYFLNKTCFSSVLVKKMLFENKKMQKSSFINEISIKI